MMSKRVLAAPVAAAVLMLAGCAGQTPDDTKAWEAYRLDVAASEANAPNTLEELSERADIAVRGKIVKVESGPTYGEGLDPVKTIIITIEPTEVVGDAMGHPLTVEWGLWGAGEATEIPKGEYLFFLERVEGYQDWICVSASLCPLGVDANGQVYSPRQPDRLAELDQVPGRVADTAELLDELAEA